MKGVYFLWLSMLLTTTCLAEPNLRMSESELLRAEFFILWIVCVIITINNVIWYIFYMKSQKLTKQLGESDCGERWLQAAVSVVNQEKNRHVKIDASKF